MDDIGKDLYAKIDADITNFDMHDKEVTRLFKKVTMGTATHADTAAYAERLGEYTSEVLQRYLTDTNLPDGKLYYNIAESTVGQVLEDNHGRVNEFGSMVQDYLNQQAGIGLKSVPGEFNRDRADTLVSDMANCEELEHARELMQAPVTNMTQTYADGLVKANADFHYGVGLSPTIVRTADPGCCPWCQSLVGEHPYPVINEDVYHRHERCRCVVTYHPNKTSGEHAGMMQDVWTKEWSKEDLRTFNL